ncbi:MAG TPA: hypothetical protein VFS22_06710 [Flavisolibacter sp.]|nr:hypothetical protein [Flavisolibacter sp.]
MRKIKLVHLAVFCVFVTAFGCNNSGTTTDATTKDTTTVTPDTANGKDTMVSNPDAMSDPH